MGFPYHLLISYCLDTWASRRVTPWSNGKACGKLNALQTLWRSKLHLDTVSSQLATAKSTQFFPEAKIDASPEPRIILGRILFWIYSKSTHLWHRFWGAWDDGFSDEIDANPSQNRLSTQLGGCKITCWDVWKIVNRADMAGFHLKSAHLGRDKIKPGDVWKMKLWMEIGKGRLGNWQLILFQVNASLQSKPRYSQKTAKLFQDLFLCFTCFQRHPLQTGLSGHLKIKVSPTVFQM